MFCHFLPLAPDQSRQMAAPPSLQSCRRSHPDKKEILLSTSAKCLLTGDHQIIGVSFLKL